jgi:hypothetical protein
VTGSRPTHVLLLALASVLLTVGGGCAADDPAEGDQAGIGADPAPAPQTPAADAPPVAADEPYLLACLPVDAMVLDYVRGATGEPTPRAALASWRRMLPTQARASLVGTRVALDRGEGRVVVGLLDGDQPVARLTLVPDGSGGWLVAMTERCGEPVTPGG